MANILGAQGLYPNTRGQASTAFTLQPGATRLIPTGTWKVETDGYSFIQEFDPVQDIWTSFATNGRGYTYVNSDGVNYRVANLSGCVVGAVVTTAGSGYTAATAPVVTFSAGAATATAIIGGAVTVSPTVTNAGTNYTYPPLVFLDPPPVQTVGGAQATGYATLSGSGVASITIDNQGFGYTNVPTVYIINDPRDTTGGGAQAVATLTASGTVTGIVVTNQGTPLTTVPTISFSSGSAAATAIMVRSIGAYTVTTSGTGYAGTVEITGLGSGLTATSVLTNPRTTTGLVQYRKASIVAALSGGALTATGQVVIDGGIYAGANTAGMVYGYAATTNGTVAFTYANNNSNVNIYPV